MVDCLEYTYDNSETLNINRNQVVVTGDSAGGGMTLSGKLDKNFDFQSFESKLVIKMVIAIQ